MENKIRIIFTSDWASIRKFAPVIEENPSEVYGDLIEDLANADLRIVNLEIPLCDIVTRPYRSNMIFLQKFPGCCITG